ncbi:MAG TPA: filamentous hemagglutinin N-terminal domain-containing protein, partial [Rhodanobacteraceae bacterium]|nr:filamentous hemagglutinin N-terminal domain-containing protein [Rhodanobacteraceae bacterium]
MKSTTSKIRRTPVGPELTRSGAPWLRYKKLAFSLALAAGSLSVAGVASAAGGVAAGAGPTGGTVVGGVGSITQNGASTVINQQSKLLSLNWQTFNVGKDASVLFNQPSFNAVALNRILDQSPSQIFGRINSNGQIFLINTHGIIFGSSAQLNVGGLVASTLDLTPDDFLKQHFNLDAHGGHAGIVNQGTIAAASGGSVSLIGGHVENDGLIVANYGQINLDGADKAVLDFDGDGLVNIQITGALEQRLDTEQAAVANKGTLRANDGTVVLQASAAKGLFTDLVNNSGVIDAHGISTDGGVVRLVGNGGNTINSGSIDVSGVHGGSAQLLSDQNVGVAGGSINASGTRGGGSIRVGGGWQGGEGLQTASATYVAQDATLNADATQSGNGGSVVVWGNNANNFYGRISARGGANGGNGGQVETSAHYGLNAQGTVDASAPRGSNGTWLLDPYDVTISTGADTNTGTAPYYTASGTGSVVNAGEIDAALTGNTDVFVFTNNASTGLEAGNITLSAPISAAGAGSLYLQAVGSILLDNTITAKSTTKPLNVYLWANYGGVAGGFSYTGNTTCNACQVIIGSSANAGITTDGGNVFIQTGDALHAGGGVQLGSSTTTGFINAGTGSLNVIATGISQQGAGTITAGAASLDAGSGAITLTNAGNDFTGAVTATGTGVALTDANALSIASLAAGTGDVALNASGGVLSVNGGVSGNNVSLTGSGGISLSGNVTSAGTQTYNNAVTLGADVIAGSTGNGAIEFKSTVDGAHALAVNTGGATTFGGAVGGTTALTSLTTDAGGSTALGGNVSTTGAQTYNDAVAL